MNFFILFFLIFGTSAQAGEFYEKNGLALNGHDPVSYFETTGPLPGAASFTATHKGSKFRFASKANRDKFLKNPEKFSPQFNGFCAFGMARGYKAKIEPEAYSLVNGKLYLNYDLSIRKKWLRDQNSLIEEADKNWPSVKSSTKVHD